MLNAGNPIGVMDSGIGGLTVVRELQRILPGEDIIYFGDSANCPYGNKTSDQIFELSSHMLQFLGDNGVKCTAIACNTISTMADRLRPCFDYKIVSIVEEAAKYVLREHLKSVGLIATEFTVASGKYAELIHEGDPECKVVGKGSPLLAALVDRAGGAVQRGVPRPACAGDRLAALREMLRQNACAAISPSPAVAAAIAQKLPAAKLRRAVLSFISGNPKLPARYPPLCRCCRRCGRQIFHSRPCACRTSPQGRPPKEASPRAAAGRYHASARK